MTTPSVTLRLTVAYGQYLETMTSTLNQRLDRFLCFIQFLLGASVFADSRYGWLTGTLIALISAFQFACKPGNTAGHARLQALQYKTLGDEIDKLAHDEALRRLHDIEKNDSTFSTLLCNPARLRALISLDLKPDTTLNRCERVIAALAGGIPR